MRGKIVVVLVLGALFVAFNFSTPLIAADKPVILVGNFVNETGEAKWDNVGVGLGIQITTVLSKASAVAVIPEEARHRVLAEVRFGESGFVDEATAIEAGRLAGATHVIYGTYTLLGGDLMAAAYLVDVKSAKSVGGASSVLSVSKAGLLCVEVAQKMLAELNRVFVGGTDDGLPIGFTPQELSTVETKSKNFTIDALALKGEVDSTSIRDLSVKIVAIVYNYSGMVWEAFDGGSLDGYNAVIELKYVRDMLNGAHIVVDDILKSAGKEHPAYKILHPHILCYKKMRIYLDALAKYFNDPTKKNLDFVYEAQSEVEPYMQEIGLEIGARGAV